MKIILFICTGNLCRSPMAEAFMNDRLRREGIDDVLAASAGTWTTEGAPLPTHTARVLAERGLSLGEHRARNVTAADMASAGLILAMTRSHVEALKIDFPTHADQVYLLSEIAGRPFDVPDPYGRSLDAYRQTANIIDSLLEEGYEQIMARLGQ